MEPRVEVSDHNALMDEEIAITVSGLNAGQKVTVSAEVREKGQHFVSTGQFIADKNGQVKLTTDTSLGGTYTGVSAMGLFWSMQAGPGMKKGARITDINASQALLFPIHVHDGHLTPEDIYEPTCSTKCLCSLTIRRWYMAKDVQKIKVQAGRIRGSLFLPKGPGPFPGIIDMFGVTGTLMEFRAALLASHGFAALSLVYFKYKGMPSVKKDVEFEYFEEAAAWLSSHPMVASGGIGTLGVSMGGEISLHMGHYIPQVKASVTINGCPFFTESPIKYRGEDFGKTYLDVEKVVMTDEGHVTKHLWNCKPEDYLPLWETDTHYLLIAGEDDAAVDYKVLQKLHEMYPASRRHLCELEIYPGAGHLIEPPYAPYCRSTFKYYKPNKASYHILWGGRLEEHAQAQKHSWKRILEFFKMHLPHVPTSKHDSKL